MTPYATIRPERPGDEPGIRGVLMAAFGGSQEADLVAELRASSEAWLDGLSLVAIADEELVGYLLFTRVMIEQSPAIGLAPLAVSPARQKQGLGDALVRTGLARARAMGETIAVVIGHPSYYPRFGFVPAIPLGLTSVFARPGHEAAFMALALREGALDGVKGRVRYASPFSAFE